MDGDSRGGAALSMKAVSGRPVKFISTGEKLEALEAFYPDRVASRILGKPFSFNIGICKIGIFIFKFNDALSALSRLSAEN